MNVTPLVVDQTPESSRQPVPDAGAFGRALDGAGNALLAADRAEDAFAAHAGTLQDAVFERAQADVMLSVAAATAQRAAQAIQTVLNLQI